MKKVILAGGSGMLGRALTERLLASGFQVVILSRSSRPPQEPCSRSASEALRYELWDAKNLGSWKKTLEEALAIVNLSGKSVDCRYTESNQRELLSSRVDSVQVLLKAVRACTVPPRALVQASALGVYGDCGEEICDEGSSTGQGFSADLCQQWEAALNQAPPAGLRLVILRLGIVLGLQGGALSKLTRMVRCFVGGAAGDGRQYVSWLHSDDLLDIFLLLLWCAWAPGRLPDRHRGGIGSWQPTCRADTLGERGAFRLQVSAFVHRPAGYLPIRRLRFSRPILADHCANGRCVGGNFTRPSIDRSGTGGCGARLCRVCPRALPRRL